MTEKRKEPQSGGTAARHEQDLTVEKANAKTFDEQGHHYQGETETRKKFPLDE